MHDAEEGGPDDGAFRRDLDTLLDRRPGPELYDAVWSFIEGRSTRRELLAHPDFGPAWAELRQEQYARSESAGVDFVALRADLRARVEAEDRRDGGSRSRALL